MNNKAFVCSVISMILLFVFAAGCSSTQEPIQYDRWTVSEPVFKHGGTDTFDSVAVKDPSIVFYNGAYHLFYTAKSSSVEEGRQKFDISTGYVAAARLEELNQAKRYDFKEIVNDTIIAPQIFYFSPQKKWYLFGHQNVANKRDLVPIYMTNTNIENIYGWSKPVVLKTGKIRKDFWIDFWIICDDEKAHLFYSDQQGSVLRMECPLNEFPKGFTDAKEEVALTVKGYDDYGAWRMFEAEHVYRIKKADQYLILLECGYENLGRGKLVDSRRRFMIAMVADKLEGPWRRVESGVNEYFACGAALYNSDGSKSAYTQVSHPELVRSGYDQKLEIEDGHITMLMQSFDGSDIPDDYQYSNLPWELAIIKNF